MIYMQKSMIRSSSVEAEVEASVSTAMFSYSRMGWA